MGKASRQSWPMSWFVSNLGRIFSQSEMRSDYDGDDYRCVEQENRMCLKTVGPFGWSAGVRKLV